MPFWRKKEEPKDETTLRVVTSTGGTGIDIFVTAQTVDKAWKLYKKLKKEG